MKKMKRKASKPESGSATPKTATDQTLHIEWPWSMTWMEYVDEMLALLKSQIGPLACSTKGRLMRQPSFHEKVA